MAGTPLGAGSGRARGDAMGETTGRVSWLGAGASQAGSGMVRRAAGKEQGWRREGEPSSAGLEGDGRREGKLE